MNNSFLEKQFKLKENNTTVSIELLAGITTFMTMAYILVVNPSILSLSGMDYGGVFTATIVSSIIGCVMMAFLANYPFALSAGMGLNAFFTYTVVFSMQKSWQFALTAVFIEGIIFILLSLFEVREAIFDAIPSNLKKAVSVGIGIYISLIGLTSVGVVSTGMMTKTGDFNPGGLIIQMGNLSNPNAYLTLIGIIIMGVLLIKKVKGALFVGMIITSIIGIPLGVTNLPNQLMSLPPSMSEVMFKFEFNNIFTFDMLIVVFSFLFVDIFDTIGTLIGVSTKAKMLDENGKLKNVKGALLADAIATTAGACLGTSTVTTFIESSAGVSEGARTGLSTLSTAFCFFLALFLYPIISVIPASATAPALVIVGLFMLSSVKDIDLDDYTESIPAFLTIIMMPFGYSISEGIVFGMVSYVILKVLSGKYKEVSPIMYVLAILFITKYVVQYMYF